MRKLNFPGEREIPIMVTELFGAYHMFAVEELPMPVYASGGVAAVEISLVYLQFSGPNLIAEPSPEE